MTSLLLLWLAALGLLLVPGLDLPLRDWDEGIVARVALERAEALQALLRGDGSLTELLLPTYWGAPYLNKPPGLHLLSALPQIPWLAAEQLPPPWSVRLMPALLASAVVPLAGLISHELRPTNRRAAIASAAIALTLLPLMRHGRLAMLDGALVSASGLLWWQLLRCRWRSGVQALRPGLVAGLASSALLLLKAPLLLPVLLAGLVLLAMDRALSQQGWCWLLLGLGLGLLPGISWHLFHGLQRGAGALLLWGGDGAGRVLLDAGEGSDLGWRVPLLEVLEGGWPWLPLWPLAVAAAWRERRRPLGRWPLGLQLTTAAMVLPLRTQLPWYSHLLWPPLALLCGEGLHDLVARQRHRWVSWSWCVLGILLLVMAGTGSAMGPTGWPWSSLLLAGAGLLGGGWWISRDEPSKRQRGLLVLVLGWGLALMHLWSSGLWLWELNESWDPRPVAADIRRLPAGEPVWLEGPTRPSLGWYAGRPLQRYRKSDPPPSGHWLVSPRQRNGCHLQEPVRPGNWQLWRCE